MFKGNKSKKLAFFAAMTLVGGAFAPYTYAADVTIDPSHPPVKNVPRPFTTGAAGGVGTDGADASGNTLTIRDYDYENNAVYGGAALGTGNAERNTLTIMNSKVLVGYGGAAQNGGNANHNKLVFRSGEVGATMAGGLVNSETGSAEGNSVTVHSGTTSHIYGGYSKKAKARGNVHKNEVVVNGGTIDGKIKGGVIDEVKSTGNVTENTVTINGGTVKDAIYGGAIEKSNSTGTAAGNRVTINAGTIQKTIIGGFVRGKGTLTGNIVTIAGGEIAGEVYAAFSDNSRSVLTNNVVNLGDGKRALPVNISKFVWVARGKYGATSSGNTLNVKTRAEADYGSGFEKLNFYFNGALQPKLTLRKSMDLKIASLNDIGVYGSPQMKSGTLIEKERGKIKIKDGVTSATITGDTAEMTLRLDSTEKNLDYTRLIFKGATVAESEGTDTWGGRSRIGNTTTENEIAVDGGSHTNVYGGWTTGTGSTAAPERQGNSIRNHVTVRGTAAVSGTVYGGFTDAASGAATGNMVTIDNARAGAVIGGKAGAEASGNTINLVNAAVGSVTGGDGARTNNNIINVTGSTVGGDVVGGHGTTTNSNVINLRNATVAGTVTGGTAANGTGNTLAVSYGTRTTQIGDFERIQKIHFDLEAAPTRGAHTLLKLTSVGGEKNLSGMNIGFHRDGASQKLEPGDKITLIENTGGSVVLGDNVTTQGTDGASREYTFDIVSEGNTLIATVAKAKLSTQSKSFVETRTGASAFLNDGADFLAGTGTDAAQKEAAAAAATPGAAPFGLWAGVGGGALRHKTGSYVDMKGWNLGVGWARENAVKEGTLTFGPFIEYGRGSYDSYLDDGTHGSGKTSYIGAGVMAKLETKANNWIDGALRVGRTRSDYTGLASYDTTSTYYTMHVSIGKDFHVKSGDTVSAYVRYAYAHTAGTSAHLSSGETYDFDAVNSHRLRIGTRYTHGATALSRLYAGLAWEYEFDGDAHATSQGDSAPSPSLKGGSALLELGYRFAPKADSRVSYDLNLSGWQGKRQGITGGVSVKWAF